MLVAESSPPLLGSPAAEQINALNEALARHRARPSPALLDDALVRAAAIVAAVRGPRAGEPANMLEVTQLLELLPEFAEVVALEVAEVQRAVRAEGRRLWAWCGLTGEPPEWDEHELAAARDLLACACVPLGRFDADTLRRRLRRVAAARWARQLTERLRSADEDHWRRALGPRYESVRVRYAPRSRSRVGELSALVRADQRTRAGLREAAFRWLLAGGDVGVLAAALEAGFVHANSRANLA